MPKFAAEPSTRNFFGGSKSNTKFAAEPSTVKDSSRGSRCNFQGTFSVKNPVVPSSKPAASTTIPGVVEFRASSVEALGT